MNHALLLCVTTLFAADPETEGHGLGLIMPSPIQYKRMVEEGGDFQSFAKGFKGIIPSRVDLTAKFPRPQPKGQGNVGACVGWTLAYAIKSYFTEALTEALQGRADYNKDGQVFMTELEDYVENRVKELSQDSQHPVTARPASVRSFPLAKP